MPILEIPILTMPPWLNRITPENIRGPFCIDDLLQDSLYYPCAGFDATPISMLGGNVLSFIYVDYGVSREEFNKVVDERGFRGYDILVQRPMTKKELAPRGWTPKYPRNF